MTGMVHETGQTNPLDVLRDPTVAAVSLDVAARVLGVARTTIHYEYHRTGCATDGVPVLRVGRRCLVPTAALRRALGMAPLAGDFIPDVEP